VTTGKEAFTELLKKGRIYLVVSSYCTWCKI